MIDLNFYQQKNLFLKKHNLLRKPKTYQFSISNKVVAKKQQLISFACNNYLGLAYHKQVLKTAQQALNLYGLGGRSSIFVAGKNNIYNKLQQQLCQYYQQQEALIFSSGYLACMGVISALANKNSLIIADKLIHNSLLEGAKLTQATLKRFAHNNLEHCQQILQQYRNDFYNCLIITESIFSMDGDSPNLTALKNLATSFNCLLIIDNAHILYNQPHLYKDNCLHLGTFSKSLGGLGGYAVGTKEIITYLANHSKTAIYTTALPPAILAGVNKALKIAKKGNLAKKALENAKYFCQLMHINFFDSCIVPIIIGDSKKTLQLSKKLAQEGYLVPAIRPPSVEKNKARLRISFNVNHQKKDIKKLAKILLKHLN
jgi:8-amino-7-oxononanoate synthase